MYLYPGPYDVNVCSIIDDFHANIIQYMYLAHENIIIFLYRGWGDAIEAKHQISTKILNEPNERYTWTKLLLLQWSPFSEVLHSL